MCRPIKYRGKRLDNGEWEYGYYHRLDSAKDRNKAYIIPSYASALYSFEVDPETVGQYTGLQDRNDKEMYDGDIVMVSNHMVENQPTYKALIEWNGYKFVLRNLSMYSGVFGFINSDLSTISNYLVIGNRWDHPHLLKGDDTE